MADVLDSHGATGPPSLSAPPSSPPGTENGTTPWNTPEAEEFNAEALRQLKLSGIPFLMAGSFAFSLFTGIGRQTKDMDIFCRAGDYPKILRFFADEGYEAVIEDARWIAKVCRGPFFFDVIFNSTSAVVPVTSHWFENPPSAQVYGIEVKVTPPTELIWSKVFVQDRQRYDGADVAHLMLRQHQAIDWRRLLAYMDQHWEVLLTQILNFRFIYPTERDNVPAWLMQELISRVQEQAALPPPQTRICRGRLFSRRDYHKDVTEWDFADVVGEGGRKDARSDQS